MKLKLDEILLVELVDNLRLAAPAVGRALPDAAGAAHPTCQATQKLLKASVNFIKKRDR